jgi:hypothetical protein
MVPPGGKACNYVIGHFKHFYVITEEYKRFSCNASGTSLN